MYTETGPHLSSQAEVRRVRRTFEQAMVLDSYFNRMGMFTLISMPQDRYPFEDGRTWWSPELLGYNPEDSRLEIIKGVPRVLSGRSYCGEALDFANLRFVSSFRQCVVGGSGYLFAIENEVDLLIGRLIKFSSGAEIAVPPVKLQEMLVAAENGQVPTYFTNQTFIKVAPLPFNKEGLGVGYSLGLPLVTRLDLRNTIDNPEAVRDVVIIDNMTRQVLAGEIKQPLARSYFRSQQKPATATRFLS